MKKQKIPLGKTGILSNCLKHPVFQCSLLSQTQSVRTPLVPYHLLCCTCVTYGIQYHAIDHEVIPTKLLPGEAEDFSRDSKYPKDVPLPTYLDYLHPIYLITLDWFEESSKLAV